jgi:hypothetical protein
MSCIGFAQNISTKSGGIAVYDFASYNCEVRWAHRVWIKIRGNKAGVVLMLLLHNYMKEFI